MTYTATLRGYTIGADQDWEWTAFPTGVGPGAYRTARSARPNTHGQSPLGGDWADANTIEFEVEYHPGAVPDPAGMEEAALLLRQAYAPETDPYLLHELGVELASGSYVVRGRPMAPEVVFEEGDFGYAVALVRFEALDPLWYGASDRYVGVSMPVATGGFTTPVTTPPETTGGGTSGDTVVVNDGTAPAPWQATLVGPLTTPRILINGNSVQIDGDIAAGETAVLDSRTRRVTFGGSSRPWVAFESVWTDLPPGSSQFSLRATSGTGTASLAWRDTYH